MNLNRCKFVTKLPSLLCAPNLRDLDVSGCKNLIKVDESFGHLDKLETWNLEGCSKLEILPSAPNLKGLYMSDCKNLIKVDESFGHLDKLETWNLRGCSKLEILPSRLQLRSLKHFNLSYCERLEKFPAICAPNLRDLDVSGCKNLIKVDESFGHLDKLETWNLTGCSKLEILPSGLMLRSLKNFKLSYCERLEKFPAICAPNLASLDIAFCKNLIEVHESVGDLHKLKRWSLKSCIKLEILPSRLQLRSLQMLFLNDCRRLEKFPDIHPEMKYLQYLFMRNSGIREWPSSLTHLTKGLLSLTLSNIEALGNFLRSPNKLQLLEEIDIPTANSFDGLEDLSLDSCDGDINELDFQYFPRLSHLSISNSSIISITQRISGLARLQSIEINNCKQLREIPTLPHSVRHVHVYKCPSLDPSRLLIRVRSLSLSLYI